MSGKDLSGYLQEPTKPADDMDIGALGNIDFDAVGERVEQMQAGGGEVVPADNDCVDGCKI